MKNIRLLAAIALTCWLAGCAVPARPPALVDNAAPQWYAPLPHDGRLADLTQWWQRFDDPLLVQLIDSAQSVSPNVATALSRIGQARAIQTSARAALLPTLDGQASLARGNLQLPGTPATSLQAGLLGGWEIDIFGANRDALQATDIRLQAAQAGWHEARVLVAAETAVTYLNLRSCERQLGIASSDARSRSESSRLAELTVRAGFTAPANAALARAGAAEASARATQQRAQCDIEVKTLVALSGLAEPSLRRQLEVPWQEPNQAALMPIVSMPAQLLAQRPDIYQAERDVAAASAEIGSAQAQRYPRLSLNGSIAAGIVHFGGAGSDAQTWSIGPLALTVPLFDGGRRAANVDAATARYDEAVARYSGRVRQAVREVEEALVTLESARARLENARLAADGYRISFAATEARYRSGLGTLIELEDARRTAFAAETALVLLMRERMTAWISLYRAAGGGWARPDFAPTS